MPITWKWSLLNLCARLLWKWRWDGHGGTSAAALLRCVLRSHLFLPRPLFSTVGGWYFNKTLSLAGNSFNLSFSSCVLVARHNWAGPLSAGNFHVHWFVLLTYGWNRAITEKKKHGCSVQFLLIKYLQGFSVFGNTINWQLQLFCYLKLIIKFGLQAGISLENFL